MSGSVKKCEWCGKELAGKRSDAKVCGKKCSDAKYYKENAEKERQRNARWCKEHPEEKRQRDARNYDSVDTANSFLRIADRTRAHRAKIKQDPEKYAQYLVKEQERSRAYRFRKKIRAAIDAERADPVTAKRNEAATLALMTPEKRAEWEAAREKEQERRDRKEIREAKAAALAAVELAAQKAATARHDPTWADLEWSPEPGTNTGTK